MAGMAASEGSARESAGRSLRPRAVFVDRDGTLIVNHPYLGDPTLVDPLPGVREALGRLLAERIPIYLFTNQSGVGRGLITLNDVERVNRRMLDLFGLGDHVFEAVCIATERPDEPARYRKPSPRFILESLAARSIAAVDAWMVGDSTVDWEAGRNAGVRVAAVGAVWPGLAPGLAPGDMGVAAWPGLGEWLDDVLYAGG
jgi:D-glycero-D-manno-heptose 1,7-bisphosphate phosphatase